MLHFNKRCSGNNLKGAVIFCQRFLASTTLESIIDVGQGINVEQGKIDKKNKYSALIMHRKLENIHSPWKQFQHLISVGPLIRKKEYN